QAMSQALALDRRHDVVERAARDARIVERQDMWVAEPRGDPDLAEEPLGTERAGELGLQDLDGDATLVLQVLSQIDRCHPAAAELVLDRVAPGQGGSEARQGVGHGGLRVPSYIGLDQQSGQVRLASPPPRG